MPLFPKPFVDPATVSVRIGPKTKVRLYVSIPGPSGPREHDIAAFRPGGFLGAPLPVPLPKTIFAEWFDSDEDVLNYGIVDLVPVGSVEKLRWQSVYQWIPLA